MSRATKASRRAEWMAAYERALVARIPALAGRVEWNAAVYHWYAGLTPEAAAALVR